MIALQLLALVACVALMAKGLRRNQGPVDPVALQRALDELRERERGANDDRDARLERLEHAVDAIALEVERVGEGQRFLTKVLAERAPDHQVTDPSPARGRVITPH